jgi:hypothetical protein
MQWVGSMTSSHALQISMIPASLVRAAKHELASHSVADRRQHDGKHGGLQLLGQQLSGGCRRRAEGRCGGARAPQDRDHLAARAHGWDYARSHEHLHKRGHCCHLIPSTHCAHTHVRAHERQIAVSRRPRYTAAGQLSG